MSPSGAFHRLFQSHRPATARGRGDQYLDDIAWRLRGLMEQRQGSFFNPHLRLVPDQLDQLAAAAVEMAEDLHADLGLWRALEQYQQTEFGVPLPLVMRSADPPLEQFDERRFLFFFHTLWRYWVTDRVVAPKHRDLVMLARVTREFLQKEFQNQPKDSGIRAFLQTSNRFGWEVKRKLVWMGCHSYLFRSFFVAYMMEQEAGPSDIPSTDDFLCQQCTDWMGLGAIDILASALDLAAAQRTELRDWYERHAAFYHIASLEMTGRRTDVLDAVNVVNDQPYRIRVEMQDAPFRVGQLVFGSLVPWRGEWYWSGQQRTYSERKPGMIADIRKQFFEKQSAIAYRYCPELAEKARISVRQQQAKWMAHYGQDLMVFPDGLALAAAEQRRLKAEFNATDSAKVAEVMKSHGLNNPWPRMHFPEDFLEHKDGIGAFFNPAEGVEYMLGFNRLLTAVNKRGAELLEDEREVIHEFIRNAAISPAFVRRLAQEHGAAGIGRAFVIEDFQETTDLEFLLRRFKGQYFRKRYPAISFVHDPAVSTGNQ